LARVKVRLGENEIEIDSRDFYIDNQSLDEVIKSISKHVKENSKKVAQNGDIHVQTTMEGNYQNLGYIKSNVENENNEQKNILIYLALNEISEKLQILVEESFFTQPRTVPETMNQLREHGWITSSIDVSKALVKMAFNGQIILNSREHRNYFFTKESLLTN